MKIIAFDIDDVLLARDKSNDFKGVEKYKFCTPIVHNINLINQCYEKGFYIKLYTSRGMTSLNGDLKEIQDKISPITIEALQKYNIKYHEIIFGKEHFDLLIDDKALNINDIKSFQDIQNFFGE